MKIGQSLLILAVIAAATAQAGVIFDYSPAGLTLTTGTWGNQFDGQNFADVVTFSTGAQITGYDHYTANANLLLEQFRFKLLADNGGTPGALLTQLDLSPESVVLDGTYLATFWDENQDIYRYSFSFPAITLAPGVTYWIGMTGLSTEVGQAGVQAPGDSMMAQFSSGQFQNMTSDVVGDQSFRLIGDLGAGSGTPEPATFVMLAGGLVGMALASVRRRRSGPLA